MEQIHEEKIVSSKIERVLEAFINATECIPRGICEPNAAQVVVSKHYVAFNSKDGEIRLVRDGKSVFVEVETDGCKIFTTEYDMFVLKDGRRKVYSPRLAVGGGVYTVDEFTAFVRRGFKALLSAANWV